MDAIEFLKARKRLCNFTKYCGNCPLHVNSSVCSFTTSYESDECKVVSIVEQWAKEHPIKTRQSEFLKMFPNAPLCDGVVVVDPCRVDKEFESQYCADCSSKCRGDYWLREVE